MNQRIDWMNQRIDSIEELIRCDLDIHHAICVSMEEVEGHVCIRAMPLTRLR